MLTPKQTIAILIATITFESHVELVQPLSIMNTDRNNLAAYALEKRNINSINQKNLTTQLINQFCDRLTAVASSTVKNFSQHGSFLVWSSIPWPKNC